jgi:hypothetical protein
VKGFIEDSLLLDESAETVSPLAASTWYAKRAISSGPTRLDVRMGSAGELAGSLEKGEHATSIDLPIWGESPQGGRERAAEPAGGSELPTSRSSW